MPWLLSREGSRGDGESRSPTAASSLPAGAMRLFRNASGRGFLRESSIRVRQTAEEEVEQRQSDLAYSWPVVVLDLLWNSAFVLVSFVVLACSANENPATPLRLWIVGYTFQCCVHMVCVWCEYRRRQRLRWGLQRGAGGGGGGSAELAGSRSEGFVPEGGARVSGSNDGGPQSPLSESLLQRGATGMEPMSRAQSPTLNSREYSGYYDDDTDLGAFWHRSLARQVETVNTMFSFVWWVIGLGWVLSTFDDSFQDSPALSWLCMIFLAFDIFFVIFCTALACVVGLAVCCCLPCIIAILYAVGDKDGAPPEAIQALPRFKFQRIPSPVQESPAPVPDADAELALEVDPQLQGGMLVPMIQGSGAHPRPVAAEDAECCICLCSYEDGAELRELSCGHHFDQSCLDKWLRTKPTCPLCKYDIVQGGRPGSPTASAAVTPVPDPDLERAGPPRGESTPPRSLVNAIHVSARGFFSGPSRDG